MDIGIIVIAGFVIVLGVIGYKICKATPDEWMEERRKNTFFNGKW